MKLESLVTEVKRRAEIDSRQETLCAIRATLETLGEGMPRQEVEGLAAHLPPAVGAHLCRSQDCAHISLVDFVKRVSVREQVYLPVAATHARAVVQVIGENVPFRGVGGIGEVLPAEWQPLVAAN